MLPATRRLFAELAESTPASRPSSSGSGPGELLRPMATAGSTVVGVDWRVPARRGPPAGRARRRRAGQPRSRRSAWPAWPVAEAETRDVLDRAGTRPGHIFNLGPRRPARDRPGHPRAGGRAGPRRGPGRGRGRRDADVRIRPARPPPTGVLVMAHGTPATPEEIEPFYTAIRRGRPPTPSSWPSSSGATTPSAAPRR